MEALTTEVRQLSRDAAELKEAVEQHTRTLQVRTRIVGVLLVVVVLLGVLAAVQLHAQVDASRRAAADRAQLCQLILVLADPIGAAPATERGRQIVARAQALSRQLEC